MPGPEQATFTIPMYLVFPFTDEQSQHKHSYTPHPSLPSPPRLGPLYSHPAYPSPYETPKHQRPPSSQLGTLSLLPRKTTHHSPALYHHLPYPRPTSRISHAPSDRCTDGGCMFCKRDDGVRI
ncbi:hypothetical protein IQ07DRAFT_585549, partial [Pyrenochaeta sp. DS3sAY3a]